MVSRSLSSQVLKQNNIPSITKKQKSNRHMYGHVITVRDVNRVSFMKFSRESKNVEIPSTRHNLKVQNTVAYYTTLSNDIRCTPLAWSFQENLCLY